MIVWDETGNSTIYLFVIVGFPTRFGLRKMCYGCNNRQEDRIWLKKNWWCKLLSMMTASQQLHTNKKDRSPDYNERSFSGWRPARESEWMNLLKTGESFDWSHCSRFFETTPFFLPLQTTTTKRKHSPLRILRHHRLFITAAAESAKLLLYHPMVDDDKRWRKSITTQHHNLKKRRSVPISL
jgi:hypothetical protein